MAQMPENIRLSDGLLQIRYCECTSLQINNFHNLMGCVLKSFKLW